MPKISVLLLTINRYNFAKEYISAAFKDAGIEFDLCITDNGSTESNILEWNKEQNAKVYIENGYNAGTAQALNKMIELNPSDYYVFIGNDIRMPDQWLKKLVAYYEDIPQSGVTGIDWRNLGDKYDKRVYNGRLVWESTNVFGTTFISHKTRELVGKFCEDYGPYGMWDSDYHYRCRKAGLINYYLPDLYSHHFGNDVGEDTPYRKMKEKSMQENSHKLRENMARYDQGEWKIE